MTLQVPTLFTDWISLIADFVTIIGFPLAAIVLYLTRTQMKSAAVVAKAQFILTIDQLFDTHWEVRHLLANPRWTPTPGRENNDLGRYLAVFERLGLLMAKEMLDLTVVEAFYAPRFRKVLQHPAASEKLNAHREDYEYAFLLWKLLLEKGINLPAIPPTRDVVVATSASTAAPTIADHFTYP